MADRSKAYPVQIPPVPLRPSRAPMSKRTRKRLTLALAGTIAAIVLAALLLALFDRPQQLLAVGATAPGFTLRTTAGKQIELDQLRGRVVLLEFCSTWSSQCALQAPLLNGMVDRVPSLVSINADSENAASVRSFERNHHVRFPILLDPGEKTVSFPTRGPRGPVTGRYRVTRLPTFYVLDRAGRVVWRSAGSFAPNALQREVRRAARSVP